MDNSITQYWTLHGLDGRALRCGLVRTAHGLEVHASGGEHPRRETVHSESDGLNIAEAWKALYLARGWVAVDPLPASSMTMSKEFKIDRSQRIHSDGLVVRVYQVFGSEQYGWDTNREKLPTDRPVYSSRDLAEAAADDARRQTGHVCDERCYAWRALM